MSEFKYVPVDPTEEMIAAGCKAGWFGVKAIIKAALEAATTQPSQLSGISGELPEPPGEYQ